MNIINQSLIRETEKKTLQSKHRQSKLINFFPFTLASISALANLNSFFSADDSSRIVVLFLVFRYHLIIQL